ncbi:hypothetical protein C1752_03272 [Acaryochloris thomasi RCC1774]|uniref:Uncharacterized protein n=1 Tax=Acaryochloris thomasi RCC1774 TaxID=1764569 RepID=A0A2W1JPK6_9CYAN|nr:hypothetical protein [Acaryochloris thomasi]PZD72822.1 hypothetical protein C1752_03272 [Acaryochloris thomasi RCC1774]
MHRFRQLFLYCQTPLSILRLGLLVTLAFIYCHHSTFTVHPILLAGIAEPLTSVTSLTLFTTAGILALGKGMELPVLWALSATAGVACIHLGLPLTTLGVALAALFGGWELTRRHSFSDNWIALSGAVACSLLFAGSSHWHTVMEGTGLTPLTSDSYRALIPWGTGTAVYLLGFLIGQIIISLAAYQAAFWLFWHLGDRANVKFRLGRLMVCGVGVVYGWSTFLG